ncbi:MAG: SPOR domain-containing protein [Deltaproteobacteria bacterium]|nr:SPOR domain-containing protein [Deltaproteobacteria bacterium]
MSQKSEEFEFKLGRSGLMFFTFAIALVLLFAFVCGVMVGKNIESYPEKIAKGIPEVIKETIAKGMDSEPDTAGHDAVPDADQGDAVTDMPAAEEKVEFTFYERLKETGENVKETFTAQDATPSDTADALPEKRDGGGLYTIQVASFRDRGMTDGLKEKLSHMGYAPRIDEATLPRTGKWFRVKIQGFATYDEARTAASLVESKIKGIKCLIIKNRESE